ncbi:MAG: FAD-dependent oxidoreductase [Velocimicrobium sp.]
MKITIDGKELEAKEGMSILDTALEAGIYIPHLCKHPELEAVGGCRLCGVEIEGMDVTVPSCKTKVQEGMKIAVNGPKAEKTRKMAMELILATHPADCTGCPKYGKCELQSMYQYLGVGPERWRKKSRTVVTDESNPLIKHLFTRCIRCGRCVRACRELRGVKVLDYQKTESGIQIGIDGNVSLKEAGCKFCGACIEVCPTGSIMDALGVMKEDMSYAESIIPCKTACPGHTDIPRYLRYIKEGEYEKAIAVIREKLPFPETLGSICNHVCESECKRNELGEPLSICKLKKKAAANDTDEWKKKRKQAEPTNKKAAIIGAGPAGLTAAYYLAKKGHEVTVFEANEKAGGQCRYGIPSYRLPDAVLDREINDILEIGIKLELGTKLDNPQTLLEQGYDTVLISIGTHQGTRLPLEGNDLEGVMVNAEFLKKSRMGIVETIGEKVMVLGGGNVAYDCARTALRLGAKEVHIACLENEETMTATSDEIEEGREEGIILHSAHSFLRIQGNKEVEGVELQKIDKFYFDENRKAVIELVEGTKELIVVDNVIFAVGQKPEGTEKLGVELTHGPYVKVNENLSTSMKGVFAAGDVVTGTKSVVEAIAAGRRCAEVMDCFLGGDGDISEELLEKEDGDSYIGRCEGFGDLMRLKPHLKDAEVRKKNFDVVEDVFTNDEAKNEASRCLQCDLRLQLTQPKLWNEY